ncbi:MAG: hypothetical protein COA79_19585 [Planctomycetota bacterium]|nr:MAG: hypothetical protein COA79_19585 [Planctomycetota bacterium]
MGLPKKGLNLNKFKKPLNAKISPISTAPKIPRFAQIDKRKNRIIEDIENIPSLPSVIFEITKLANSPTSSARDIEGKMKDDQVLTAKILKIANSPYYALNDKATTVTRAVALLGFSALKSIVIASSCSDTLNKDLGIYGFAENGLWKHSLACATVSKEIGKKIFHVNDKYEEELFIAGLIHDIGKIAIAPVLKLNKDEFDKAIEDPAITQLEQAEKLITGIDHTEVGDKLITKWKLSDMLRSAITNHHNDPENKFDGIVHLADWLSTENKIGLVDDYPWHGPLSDALLTKLGISQDNFQKLQDYINKFLNSEDGSPFDELM